MSEYLKKFDHEIVNIGNVVNPFRELVILSHSDELYDEIYGDESHYTVQGSDMFKAWCKEHKVHYYGQPSERFVAQEGLDKAREAGAVAVILESMS